MKSVDNKICFDYIIFSHTKNPIGTVARISLSYLPIEYSSAAYFDSKSSRLVALVWHNVKFLSSIKGVKPFLYAVAINTRLLAIPTDSIELYYLLICSRVSYKV